MNLQSNLMHAFQTLFEIEMLQQISDNKPHFFPTIKYLVDNKINDKLKIIVMVKYYPLTVLMEKFTKTIF